MVPETGIFVALKEGLWRFTFVAGDALVSNSGDYGTLIMQGGNSIDLTYHPQICPYMT